MSVGMGVMIAVLRGDPGVDAYRQAVGKTLKEAVIEENYLALRFTDGYAIGIHDDGQSCCEVRYMTCDDDLTSFVGAEFKGIEVRDADPGVEPHGDYDHDEHECQFLLVNTSKGTFTVANHNEHNGYYGGFALKVTQIGVGRVHRTIRRTGMD